MPLFLREADVHALLPMPAALERVEDALRDYGEGKAQNRARQRVRAGSSTLHVMPGGWSARSYLGFKAYTAAQGRVRFYVHLFNAETGEHLAIMEADRLGQMRTGAASGVATKYLARKSAATVGIVGTGWQAQSQLQAVCAVRAIQTVKSFSRDEKRRAAFAEKMTGELNIPVRAVDSAEAAVRESEIVIAITSSATPVVNGEWLMPGAHVNAAGSNWAQRREVDRETVRRAATVFADSVEQAQIEAGDLIQAVAEGALSWQQVQELSALVAGRAVGRTSDSHITFFKSCGLAIEDVAVGSFVYEQAKVQGAGQELSF